MSCHGNCARHCCVFRGTLCPYLEQGTIPDRIWACGLYRELGDWKKVLIDTRYKKDVAPLFELVPEFDGKQYNCSNYPQDIPEVLIALQQEDCGWFEEAELLRNG